ncbi:MAG: class I SAM-dependent methyltransferase [Anaerolineales bacterium]|nr:class I SAM-dependent methyltransferase [Anaerolineales bacterium]
MDSLIAFIVSHWVVIMQGVFIASLMLILWIYLPFFWGSPWVPGPYRVIHRMLELADIKPGQTVIDLGAGDGRIVILAALKFNARAVGVEIDPFRCLIAKIWIALLGLRGKAEVRLGDMRRFPVDGADVVTLYLLQGTNQKLKPRLAESLKPGAKVVSHTFSMSGWTPAVIDTRCGIFVYEIGRMDEEIDTKVY